MNGKKYDLGLIGLGTMGRNLILNMADQGFAVTGFDKDTEKVEALKSESGEQKVHGSTSLEEFISLLKVPRSIMMLVPAGKIVDAVIEDILPHLESGDMIIDGGNSHFTDTNRRQKELAKNNIRFIGLGISGGAEGARRGPSMMPGGQKEAYENIRPLLEATAAKVNGDPCVTYLGAGSAGHYVKMVHNGIEYGMMQLIAETYDIMKRGLGMDNEQLYQVYNDWNQGELQSFLVEITAKIFQQPDDHTDGNAIDMILDKSKQKGTGKWTSQDAMDLQVPLPTVDMAVAMRDMSGYKEERETADKVLSGPEYTFTGDKQVFIHSLKNALYFSFVVTYAQGMAQLKAASADYNYNLKLKDVARIWRGGCIIRAALLEDIMQAYESDENLPNLLINKALSKILMEKQNDTREVIKTAISSGIPVPGIMTALAYFDAYRSGRLPANLIQAQRDFFGSHTYERIDREGVFHTNWNG